MSISYDFFCTQKSNPGDLPVSVGQRIAGYDAAIVKRLTVTYIALLLSGFEPTSGYFRTGLQVTSDESIFGVSLK